MITPYISVYRQEIGNIMEVNSFYIPCSSYIWKSKHFVKNTIFKLYFYFLDEDYCLRVELQISISIILSGFSHGIRKEKTKLTHQFHSLFLFLQLFCSTLFY